jgi:hypothetical protein
MLRECSRPDCSILTLGPYCIEHEPVRVAPATEAPRERELELEPARSDARG